MNEREREFVRRWMRESGRAGERDSDANERVSEWMDERELNANEKENVEKE